jgi:hypothetical protein
VSDRVTIERIKNKKVLVVEGEDDVGFFVKLVEYLKIQGLFVIGLGGKDFFNIDLPDMQKRPGFSDLTHFAVIRDKNGDNAFESVANILKKRWDLKMSPQRMVNLFPVPQK